MFKNRVAAGKKLAAKLIAYKDTDAVVLAIPRGGVPVGDVIAQELRLPLDIILTKKIGHPSNSEYAIGAVSIDSVHIEDHPDISKEYIERKTDEIRAKLIERMKVFHRNKTPVSVGGRTIILVDDGIATGNTILATMRMLRNLKPNKIVVAVPVAPTRAANKMREAADEYICLEESDYFPGVGAFYVDFNEVTDEDVTQILHSAA